MQAVERLNLNEALILELIKQSTDGNKNKISFKRIHIYTNDQNI